MARILVPGEYPRVSAYLSVEDGAGTLGFLAQLLGAEVRLDHRDEQGRLQHGEVRIGDSLLMVSQAAPAWPACESHIHVYVDDVDACYTRALELGARSVQEPRRKDDPDRRAGVWYGGTTWWLATCQQPPAPVDLAPYIRTVMDFPRPGIAFKDITPLLAHPEAFAACIRQLAERVPQGEYSHIAGIESRGFLFGATLARETGKAFLPLRKPGKLPWACHRVEYALEYGSDALEIHQDACGPGDRVLLVDDLLATGGTMLAASTLVRELGAEVAGALFVIGLDFLPGRQRLQQQGIRVESLLVYTGEEA
jgi:adenine phosphoribosyltransferase